MIFNDPKIAKDKARPIIETFLQYMGNDRSQWAKEVAQDIEYVNNVQWTEDEAQAVEATNAPALAINEIKISRDRVVGQMTKNAPRWIAVAVENSDVKLAGDVSDLISWIWDKSKGNMHVRKAVESFEDTGMFAMMSYVDPYGDMGKGEIKICWVDPERIYIDPRCTFRDISDSSRVFITDIYSKSRIMTDYPDFDLADAEEYKGDLKVSGTGAIRQGQVFNAGFLGEEHYYRVIDSYQKIKVRRIRVYDPKSVFERVMTEEEYQSWASKDAVIQTKLSGEQAVVDEDEVKKILRMVSQYGTTFHFMSDNSIMPGTDNHPPEVDQSGQYIYPVPNSTVHITRTNMYGLIEQGYLKSEIIPVDRVKRDLIIGEKLYFSSVMPVSEYPFAITMLHHTGNPYCYGDARLAKPIQELINKIHSIIIKYNINVAGAKVILPDGTDLTEFKEHWGEAGAYFFTADMTEGQPLVVQLQQMANELYVQLDRLKLQIQRIYGAYDYQDGIMNSPPQTRGGTLAIYEAGMNRSETKLQLIEEALNGLGSVVAEMIPYVYDRRKVIRILSPNNKVKDITFNETQTDNGETRIINDLTANKYDIKMLSGSTLPSNRWARHEAYMQMWEKGLIRNPEPILRLTDLPDIDEVIQNEDRLRQAEGIIQNLNDTLKKMEGDAQTKDRMLESADRQVTKAKYEASFKGIQAQLQAWLDTAKARLNDNVKINKSLSKGATEKTSQGRGEEKNG